MHDPMVVAFEIRRPWPRRERSYDAKPGKPRWKARYEWATWRKPWSGWRVFWTVAGKGIYWPGIVTIWHVEPGGRDALTVCRRRYRNRRGEWRYSKTWRWHVHHWRIQVILVRKIHRFLFERCEECGRRFPWGYAPVAHQWDQPRGKWFRITRRAYHHQCSSLVHYRREAEHLTELVKYLAVEIQSRSLEDEVTMVDRLTGTTSPLEFPLSRRLQRILGFERDDDYNLVKKETGS